jgi:hypothetical protein
MSDIQIRISNQGPPTLVFNGGTNPNSTGAISIDTTGKVGGEIPNMYNEGRKLITGESPIGSILNPAPSPAPNNFGLSDQTTQNFRKEQMAAIREQTEDNEFRFANKSDDACEE